MFFFTASPYTKTLTLNNLMISTANYASRGRLQGLIDACPNPCVEVSLPSSNFVKFNCL